MVKVKIVRVAADGSDGEEVCTLAFAGTMGSSGRQAVGFHNEILPAIAGSKAFAGGTLMWLETDAWATGGRSSAHHAVKAPIRIRKTTYESPVTADLLKEAVFSGKCVLSNALGERFRVTATTTARITKEDMEAMPPEPTIEAEGECGKAGTGSYRPTPVVRESVGEYAKFLAKVEGYAPTDISEL